MDAEIPVTSDPDRKARIAVFLLFSVSFAAIYLSHTITQQMVALAALAGGGALLTVAIGILVARAMRRTRDRYQRRAVQQLMETDPAYCFLCGPADRILLRNPSARAHFKQKIARDLAAVIADIIPQADGVVYRLRRRAKDSGFATENLTTPQGSYRIQLQHIDTVNSLWRIEPRDSEDDRALKRDTPFLTLGRNGTILYMNEPARKFIGRRARRIEDVLENLPLGTGKLHRMRDRPHCQVYAQSRNKSDGRLELILIPVEPQITDGGGDFDSLPVPLLRVAQDGKLERANNEARGLLRLGPGDPGNLLEHMEGLGRPVSDWIKDAFAGRGPNRSEFLRLTRSDQEIFVQVTLSRVVDDGTPSLIAILNDATELKTLEAQFVQSQKMQAIGQLAGGVAHDFNNLLTAISGHCDLLLLNHDQGDSDYGDLVQIHQNANRAASLVGQLLAFSRKQTMRPEVLDLRNTLSDLTHLLNRLVGEKVCLVLKHNPVLSPIRGDRRQLEQVIMNLVVNARDAMPDGGKITVETEQRVFSEAYHRDRVVVPPGSYVAVNVIDEGIGIPKDKLQKVFEPFVTSKRPGEGTGLGLSTAYGIVKQSGGYIFVNSVVGQGTCFTLLFPSFVPSEPEQTVSEPRKPKSLSPNGSGVVLLVEDEAPVRAFAARALRLRGYTVIEAETAEDALDMLEDNTLEVDVFVTDVVMPGMDGPTWVRKAQEKRPEVRVVFVSGYAEDVFREGRAEVSNSVFLPKPFSLIDLTETVHRQFD